MNDKKPDATRKYVEIDKIIAYAINRDEAVRKELALKQQEEKQKKLEDLRKTRASTAKDVSKKIASKKVIIPNQQTGLYVLEPQSSTYAEGMHNLRDSVVSTNSTTHPRYQLDGKEIVRPLTFEENLQAQVEDFNRLTNVDGTPRTLEKRLSLL